MYMCVYSLYICILYTRNTVSDVCVHARASHKWATGETAIYRDCLVYIHYRITRIIFIQNTTVSCWFFSSGRVAEVVAVYTDFFSHRSVSDAFVYVIVSHATPTRTYALLNHCTAVHRYIPDITAFRNGAAGPRRHKTLLLVQPPPSPPWRRVVARVPPRRLLKLGFKTSVFPLHP